MIISKFSIVTRIDCNFGDISISDKKITIHYSGNNIYQIENNEENIIGKVLLNWMEGTNRLYVVLKNDKIYLLDQYNLKEISWIINHTELISKIYDMSIL